MGNYEKWFQQNIPTSYTFVERNRKKMGLLALELKLGKSLKLMEVNIINTN